MFSELSKFGGYDESKRHCVASIPFKSYYCWRVWRVGRVLWAGCVLVSTSIFDRYASRWCARRRGLFGNVVDRAKRIGFMRLKGATNLKVWGINNLEEYSSNLFVQSDWQTNRLFFMALSLNFE